MSKQSIEHTSPGRQIRTPLTSDYVQTIVTFRGDGYHARARNGERVATASSTSEWKFAALAAGAKYFACDASELEAVLITPGNTVGKVSAIFHVYLRRRA